MAKYAHTGLRKQRTPTMAMATCNISAIGTTAPGSSPTAYRRAREDQSRRSQRSEVWFAPP